MQAKLNEQKQYLQNEYHKIVNQDILSEQSQMLILLYNDIESIKKIAKKIDKDINIVNQLDKKLLQIIIYEQLSKYGAYDINMSQKKEKNRQQYENIIDDNILDKKSQELIILFDDKEKMKKIAQMIQENNNVIEQINKDLLYEIFDQYGYEYDILKSYPEKNTYIRFFAIYPTYDPCTQELYLIDNQYTIKFDFNILTHFGNLKKLTIKNCKIQTNMINCQSLIELNLETIYFDKKSIQIEGQKLKILSIHVSDLENILSCPNTLVNLTISKSRISNLDNLPYNLLYLICNINCIKTLDKLPQNLLTLNCNENKITRLYNLPKKLTKLYCGCNMIYQLRNLPQTLEILFCQGNKIQILDNLPQTLKELFSGNNQIQTLNNLPQSLLKLNCSGNQIKILNNLPQSLLELECSNNLITQLDDLPQNLNWLYCKGNKIMSYNNLPQSLQYFDKDETICEQLL